MEFPQSPVFGGEGVISQINKRAGYLGLTGIVICVSIDQVSGGDKMRGGIRDLKVLTYVTAPLRGSVPTQLLVCPALLLSHGTGYASKLYRQWPWCIV